MFREAFCVTITVSWSKGSTISYELELHALRQKKSLKIYLNLGLNRSVEERGRGKCPDSKLICKRLICLVLTVNTFDMKLTSV